MQPLNRLWRRSFIESGASQLLVGPASFWDFEQMNVRCSTRATSRGSLRTRREFGRFFSSSQRPAPDETMRARMSLSSASEPSHQKTVSGWVRATISSTQARIDVLVGLADPGV